jgi:hypothetical protein
MEPDISTERWTPNWQPSASSSSAVEPQTPRVRRTSSRSRRIASRRSRSEATRNMLEMLRALAQSEANNMQELNNTPLYRLDGHTFATEAESIPALLSENCCNQDDQGHSSGMGMAMLRAQLFGGQPDDTELNCRYCNQVFRLSQGGASFEGSAACWRCEPQLNRDLVLPAVSKQRGSAYPAVDVAERAVDLHERAIATAKGQAEDVDEDEEALVPLLGNMEEYSHDESQLALSQV